MTIIDVMSAWIALSSSVVFLWGCATAAPAPVPDEAAVPTAEGAAAPGQVDADERPSARAHDLAHAASGMRFPIEVEGFQRDGMAKYDARGDDVSVGYHRMDETMALTATVYVYPAERYGRDLDTAFNESRDAVLRNRKGAELLAEGDMQIYQRGEYRQGKRAHFFLKDPSGARPLVVSHLFLFVHGPWFIKYRATFPAAQHEVCDDALLRFMAALRWPDVTGVLAQR